MAARRSECHTLPPHSPLPVALRALNPPPTIDSHCHARSLNATPGRYDPLTFDRTLERAGALAHPICYVHEGWVRLQEGCLVCGAAVNR